MPDITYYLAFTAGLLSFLSPCVLGLFPSYLTFITGVSFETLVSHENRKQVVLVTLKNSLAFVLGFSVIFIAMGGMASIVGRIFFQYREWIRVIGGVIIIVFALSMVGFLHLDFLSREVRYHFLRKPAGIAGSFLVGLGFAAGWIPCSGPILSAILLYATSEGSAAYGVKLLGVYSVGLALPFLVFGLSFNYFLSHLTILSRYKRLFIYVAAAVMILFGVLLVSGGSQALIRWMPDFGVEYG
jgi:cytochrome c-type biogenesis protein